MVSTPIRTAVIGFGSAGRVFHAPFIEASPRFSLDVIVTGDPERAGNAARLYPGARVVPAVDVLFDAAADLDLVVVGAPPAVHAPLAHRALDHGLAVVVDKPFCVSVAEGQALLDRSQEAGAALTVFHNRRWDGDYLTVRALLQSGSLGDVHRFESRFEWWKPQEPKVWKAQSPAAEGGGVLYDLGPHLIDQALQLFGPVETVHAELARRRPGEGADDQAFVSLLHRSGVRSHLSMDALAATAGPRFHVLGSRAAYTKWGKDPQEAALKNGLTPDKPGFGAEPEDSWGTVGVDGDVERLPTRRGSYGTFYDEMADSLTSGAPMPVDPSDGLEVIELIERIHSLNFR